MAKVLAWSMAWMPTNTTIPSTPTQKKWAMSVLNQFDPEISVWLSWIGKKKVKPTVSAPIVDPATNQVVQQWLQPQAPTALPIPWTWVAPTEQVPVEQSAVVWDDSFIGDWPKKWLLQLQAEKKWLTKDWEVTSQDAINKFAINKASSIVKSIASKWEKVDEARLNDIYEKTVANMGLAPWSQQYIDAVAWVKNAYLDQVKRAWFTGIDQSLLSLNKKYSELWSLSWLSSDKIFNSFESYTPDQKAFLQQNNPEEYQKAKAKYDESKKVESMNSELSWKPVPTTDISTQTKQQVQQIWGNNATKDYDAYVNTPELKTAEWQLTKFDTQIADLQRQLDPETMKKDIQSRFAKSLWSSALDALYYDEANDKQNALKSLVSQKEMAMKDYDRIRDENLQKYKVVKDNEEQLLSWLYQNNWMWLSATSYQDIDKYVSDWYMTPAMASVLKKQVSGMMNTTLQWMWRLQQETQDKIAKMQASWMSPSQIITTLINTWEYQPPLKQDRKTYENGDWTFTRINQNTWEYQTIPAWWQTSVVAKAQSIPDWPSNYNCATFINAVTWQAVWTTIQDKINKIDPNVVPTPWSIMVISWTNPQYWHVALVEEILPNWNIKIREANRDKKWWVRSTIIDPKNPWQAYWMKWSVKIEWYQPTSQSVWWWQWLQQNKYASTKWKPALSAWITENLATVWAIVPLIKKMSQAINTWSYSSWPIIWWIQWNNPYATNTQWTKALFWQWVKLIWWFLEWWKLAEWDQKKYEEMLPKVSDTPDVAKRKLENIKQTVLDYYNGKLWEYSNVYDVSSFSDKDASVFWDTVSDQQWQNSSMTSFADFYLGNQ